MSVEYNRVNWQQAPSEATPINARNLNNMDKGIDDVVALANANKKGIEELKTTAKQINSNLIKSAEITGTITTVADSHKPLGYYGATILTKFTGYPTDLTRVIGYLPQYCYYSDYLGLSYRNNEFVVCSATVAATFNVKGTLLYI